MEAEKGYYEEDEIDLYELWLVLKKRWKLIVGLFLCATFLTASTSFLMTPIYKSHFLLKPPTFITANETKHLITPIQIRLKEKGYNQLKYLLCLKKDTLQNLKGINCKITRNNGNLPLIEIETSRKEDIPKISNALIIYLNKNQYVAEKIQAEKEGLEKQKNILSSKLKEMEKLKKSLLKKIKTGKKDVIGFNPMAIERNIISTEMQLQNIEKNLKLLKGFEKIDEPVIPERPYKPKRRLMVTLAGIMGLFLGVFLAFFLEWLDKAKQQSLQTRQR